VEIIETVAPDKIRRHGDEPMKTNTAASPVEGLAPAGKFHGGSFGVSGTPPVAM
jgi:hypothetical protein